MQCWTGGKTTTHALGLLEPRGTLFTGIQQEVYNGMIIGECARDGEMEVILFPVACYLLSQLAHVKCAICHGGIGGWFTSLLSVKVLRPLSVCRLWPNCMLPAVLHMTPDWTGFCVTTGHPSICISVAVAIRFEGRG